MGGLSSPAGLMRPSLMVFSVGKPKLGKRGPQTRNERRWAGRLVRGADDVPEACRSGRAPLVVAQRALQLGNEYVRAILERGPRPMQNDEATRGQSVRALPVLLEAHRVHMPREAIGLDHHVRPFEPEIEPGIIVSGIAWTYLREALGPKLDDFNVLRVSVYPLPVGKVRELLDHSSELMIVEEGYPFIERFVSALGLFREKPVKGKLTGHVPRIGELNPDLLRKTFGLPVKTSLAIAGLKDVLMARPPRLCDACPHGDSYNLINEVRRELDSSMRVMGDIGCYALGYSKPYQAINSCLCMGSSIGMAIGAAHAGISPSLCVIGDGTFTHTGMNALLDAVLENTNIKVFILDNSIVAMTGGQPTTMSDAHLEELVAGLGVKKAHVRTITPVPQKHAENLAIVREELAYQGLSVIIARRACVRYVKEIKEHKRERDAAHAHEGDCANCSGNC